MSANKTVSYRLKIGLLVMIIIVSLCGGARPVGAAQAVVGGESPAAHSRSENLWLDLELPESQDLPLDPIEAQHTYRNQFQRLYERLLPELILAVKSGQLVAYKGNLETFSIALEGVRGPLAQKLSRFPGVVGVRGQAEPGLQRASALNFFDSAQINLEKVQYKQDLSSVTLQEEAAQKPPEYTQSVPELSPGQFRPRLYSDALTFYTVDPAQPVLVRVTRGSTVLVEIAQTFPSAYQTLYLNDYTINDFQMMPGDLVEVNETGRPGNSLVLPVVSAETDLSQDTITGVSIPMSDVTVSIYLSSGTVEVSATSDAAGNYSIDLTTQGDLTANRSGWLYQRDPVTQNIIEMLFRSSYIFIYADDYCFYGYSGATGLGEHQLMFTHKNSSGGWLENLLESGNNSGYVSGCFNELLSANHHLSFQTPAGELIDVTVPLIQATPDAAADLITGKGRPNITLDVAVKDSETNSWFWYYPQTDGSGNFQFSVAAQMNLTPRDQIKLWDNRLPDGHQAYKYLYVPYISAELRYREVEGYTTPNTHISITLKDSLGVQKGARDYWTASDGYFWAYFRTDYLTEPIAIDPGDTVQAVPDVGQTLSMTVHSVTYHVDIDADTVSGTTVPNSPVSVTMYTLKPERYSTYGYAFNTTSDGSGAYSVNFSGTLDLRNGQYVIVTSANAQGNEVVASNYLPNQVHLDAWSNEIYGYSASHFPITITLKNSVSAVKAQFTTESNYYGYFESSGMGDIVPGDIVEVSSPALSAPVQIDANVVTTYTVLPLEVTQIDRPGDKIHALSQPGIQVAYRVGGEYSSFTGSGYSDGSGNLLLDMAGQYNLRGGDEWIITHLDASWSVRQELEGYVPSISVNLVGQWAYGDGAPNSTVSVFLLDSLGIVKDSTQSSVEFWGGWYAYFDVPILIGDTIEMHQGSQVYTLLVTNLSLNLDAAADTASGSGPANAYLYFYISDYSDFYVYYDTYLQTDNLGNFNLDLGAVYNVKHLSEGNLSWANAEGDENSTRATVAGISMDLGNDSLFGYENPGAVVNLALTHGATQKAALNRTADPSNGFYNAKTMCSGGNRADMLIGDTLTANSGTSNVTAAPVSVNIDMAAETVSGNAPANSRLSIVARDYSNEYYWEGSTTANGSGAYSYSFAGKMDLSPGDYAEVVWEDAEGDQARYYGYTASNAGISTAFTSLPASALPNAPVFVQWNVSGGIYQESSYVMWDTISHACDLAYANYGGWRGGSGPSYSTDFLAPAAGAIFLRAFAYVDGYQVFSPEVSIPVSPMALTITDPVNGATNDNTPTLQGFGPAGAVVNFYRQGQAGSLGSTTVNSSGEFSFTLPAALADGIHKITAQSGGQTSNLVDLTVNSGLGVDPMHIFFTDRSTRMRIKDAQGYVNLGGNVWLRPNDTASIELPIACSLVNSASLTVGVVSYPLTDSGGGVWTGSFLLPSSNYAIIANITCNGIPETILLTYGLIDPDGFVFDAVSLGHLEGALVACYRLDPISQTYKVWDAATWDQVNPYVTDAEGYYSFIVPPGTYKLKTSHPSYLSHESPPITVVNAPVHYNIPLTPPSRYIYLPVISK